MKMWEMKEEPAELGEEHDWQEGLQKIPARASAGLNGQ